jgi:hypothetical protein
MTLHGLNRYHAFAIHMAISLVIFFILLVCITQYWYPGILFDSSNGWKAVGLIVGIDLILGPLLTLLVFNPAKSSIKFDLWVIALIQTSALIYGIWTIQTTRPLAIAYVNSSFMTFYANAENANEIKEKIKTLKTRQLFYVFDDENPSRTFNSEQLAPYSRYAQTIASIPSPYHQSSLLQDKDSILINIDPLMSGHRFLKVNAKSGKIIEYYKQATTPSTASSHTLIEAMKDAMHEEEKENEITEPNE